MKSIKRIVCAAICGLLLCGNVSAGSTHSSPYLGYEFNDDNKSVPAPVGYENEKVIYDYQTEIIPDLGVAVNTYYDNTDTEALYALVQTNKKILKTDSNYNVAAYYDIPESSSYSSIAYNPENGYIFAVGNAKADIYNTNGVYIKRLSANETAVFNPTKIVHVLNEDESEYIALSGNNAVFFNGDGDYLRSVAFDSTVCDAYYSSVSSSIYFLLPNKIINYTGEEQYKINALFSADSEFTMGFSEEEFYVLDKNTVYKINVSEESNEVINTAGSVLSVNYNNEYEQLNIAYGSDSINIGFYNTDNQLIKRVEKYSVSLTNATDLLYDGNENVYILDGGNGRILKMDISCEKVLEIYESFIYENKKLNIAGAKGIWIKSGKIMIADTENERVVISDFKGNVETVLLKPEKLKGLASPFKASKILTDRNGRIYCIAESVNMGAFVFSKDYEYQGFFGSNSVLTTAEALYNYIVKKFLNKEQKAAMLSNTPISLANFDIDDNGFIYVVTKTDQKQTNSKFSNLIRKINYISSDIWGNDDTELLFGDLEWDRQTKVTNTSFIDIDISEDGWVNALDGARGKVFQYSPEGQLISVFGGVGNQKGFVNTPSAIESVGDKVYVLDSYNKSITVYKPTEYVTALHDAFLNMDTATLSESTEKWNKVLNLNSNNMYAYYGLGIAYENAGNYKEAMENFKIANAKEQYSKAYKEYRKAYINDHMVVFLGIITALIVLTVIAVKKLSRLFVVPESGAYSPIETKKGLPLYILFHPADGFAQFRNRGINSTAIAVSLALLFFIIRIIEFFNTGFIFNQHKAVDYSLFSTLLGTLVIYILFALSNLAIASFLDGKGTLKHILAMTSYSMIPFLAATALNIILSNFLILDEKVFMSILLVIGAMWSLLLIIIGSIQIHEYSFGKTILSLFLTVVAMLVFAVLGILLFTLIQELISFIKAVIYEISLR